MKGNHEKGRTRQGDYSRLLSVGCAIQLKRTFVRVYFQVTFSLRDESERTTSFQSERHVCKKFVFQTVFDSSVYRPSVMRELEDTTQRNHRGAPQAAVFTHVCVSTSARVARYGNGLLKTAKRKSRFKRGSNAKSSFGGSGTSVSALLISGAAVGCPGKKSNVRDYQGISSIPRNHHPPITRGRCGAERSSS